MLRITRLKNLVDVSIEFDERRLTAILGPNGFGKSTILHALAATFAPQNGKGDDNRYADFFPNTPHGFWSGTSFNVSHYFRMGEDETKTAVHVHKEISQWFPRANNRPIREVHFIGVSSAVPKIETYSTRTKVNYVTRPLTDNLSNEIRIKAGYIFNRDYTRYHANDISSKRRLIGVEYQGVNYSALSMGAGEQRVFGILSTVTAAEKYALILIDEIDLLLHTEALNRFFEVLNDYATDKKLQIIFTTHRESVLQFESFIAVRHLYQSPTTPHKTFCFKETKPDAITRLTGQPKRPLSISCEDDVAAAIIEKVANQVGVRRFVELSQFGAADNCFTLIAALALGNQNLEDSIFVLDGDVYETNEAKLARIKKVLTGNEDGADERRQQALSHVRQFTSTANQSPEMRLHTMVKSVPTIGDAETDDVIDAANAIGAVQDNHDLIFNLITRLGCDREIGLNRIVSVASRSAAWSEYVAGVKEWLQSKVATVHEVVPVQQAASV